MTIELTEEVAERIARSLNHDLQTVRGLYTPDITAQGILTLASPTQSDITLREIEEIERDYQESGLRSHIAKVVYHEYGGSGYEGTAITVFVGFDGKLYWNHGSHCSCHGLEDQWSPDETTPEQILKYSDSDLDIEALHKAVTDIA